MFWQGLINSYRQYINLIEAEGSVQPVITLNEGNTPVLRAPAIEAATGVKNISVYLKIEGANPSGSFKDRGMTVAVTQAVRRGLKTMICASTGNTSASAAAYCACARSLGYKDTQCVVLIPDGYVALGKLAQAIVYGAKVVQVKGNFDKALEIVRELSSKEGIALVNSVNPDRIEGQKTAAFEICDQLGDSPDMLFIPVGNAGNITAYWKGFVEYFDAGKSKKKPQMMGFQAEGSAPIVKGYPIENPETIATAIRIGNPASWDFAVKAAKDSNGTIKAVSDAEIIDAYKLIHSGQGITCEPASAASVAGLLKASKEGLVPENSSVVCVLTGNGLKDPKTAMDVTEFSPLKAEASFKSVCEVLGI